MHNVKCQSTLETYGVIFDHSHRPGPRGVVCPESDEFFLRDVKWQGVKFISSKPCGEKNSNLRTWDTIINSAKLHIIKPKNRYGLSFLKGSMKDLQNK